MVDVFSSPIVFWFLGYRLLWTTLGCPVSQLVSTISPFRLFQICPSEIAKNAMAGSYWLEAVPIETFALGSITIGSCRSEAIQNEFWGGVQKVIDYRIEWCIQLRIGHLPGMSISQRKSGLRHFWIPNSRTSKFTDDLIHPAFLVLDEIFPIDWARKIAKA